MIWDSCNCQYMTVFFRCILYWGGFWEILYNFEELIKNSGVVLVLKITARNLTFPAAKALKRRSSSLIKSKQLFYAV